MNELWIHWDFISRTRTLSGIKIINWITRLLIQHALGCILPWEHVLWKTIFQKYTINKFITLRVFEKNTYTYSSFDPSDKLLCQANKTFNKNKLFNEPNNIYSSNYLSRSEMGYDLPENVNRTEDKMYSKIFYLREKSNEQSIIIIR